jgi:adenine-specific DNA-methyltransferase
MREKSNVPDEDKDTPHRGWAGKQAEPRVYEALRPRARELRKNQTKAENMLWSTLRYRKRLGFKFRRQHVIDQFIVDFYCAEARLVIEIDGAVHELTGERDHARQEPLEALGLRVMRFKNDEVMRNLDGVMSRLKGRSK